MDDAHPGRITHMKQDSLATQALQQITWSWPLDLEQYDKDPQIYPLEYAELEKRFQNGKNGHIYPHTKQILHRFVDPIEDVLRYIGAKPEAYQQTLRTMLLEMYKRRRTFWAWSIEEWEESICQNDQLFCLRYGRLGMRTRARRYLPVLAYSLKVHPRMEQIIERFEIIPLASTIFGKEALKEALEPPLAILQGWGYSMNQRWHVNACIGYLLLYNGSPHLEQISFESLETVSHTCSLPCVQESLYRISRALWALGIIKQPLPDARVVPPSWKGSTDNIAPEWLAECLRWRKHSPLQNTEHEYYQLLKAGRWLSAHYPEMRSPADMTAEIAAEFVAAVSEMKVGEWTQVRHSPDRVGQPLLPRAKDGLLKAVRSFFRDCQEWGWIPIRFNPSRVLRTPRSILHLIGPAPRVISKDSWAKLLWAAMNLEHEDLPLSKDKKSIYPLELVRAVAVVWCFAALRNNEIRRLQVGCVRWQYEDVMVPETGEILPRDATCFLDIPVYKTSTAYTKPVHPLVGKSIQEWGQITSHRARATIASQLYNAREPLTIFELKEYLGHKHLSSTQHYLLVDPTRLASKVVKAGYLEQNLATIEVLLDQEAVVSGAASRGEVWKYYDLGHGFCTNPFWASCAHRMACARCPFYRPKTATAEQLVEGKANLVRMLEFVSLTEDEKLLVTEGIELHQALIEKLADVPTLAGPTPRELETQRQGETMIPVKGIQRFKKEKKLQ